MKALMLNNLPDLPFNVTEALNQFRVNLSFCGDDVKVVMITSSVPNEGKSFVSLQLWKMMAEMGVPTLLIDCDLRNSEMKSKYAFDTGSDDPKGIIHYLAGKAEMVDVIYETNIVNGYMIPNFNDVINPVMLLEGDRFKKLIRETRESFSFVIVDTPPLQSVADALSISPLCDGSVLVVGSGNAPRKLVIDSMRLLQKTKCPFLGSVLNRLDTSNRSGGYYSRYYNSSYYYYGEDGGSNKRKEKKKNG